MVWNDIFLLFAVRLCVQNTFSKNGMDTIVVRQSELDIGQRRALSVGDIVQTRLLYRCPSQLFHFAFVKNLHIK